MKAGELQPDAETVAESHPNSLNGVRKPSEFRPTNLDIGSLTHPNGVEDHQNVKVTPYDKFLHSLRCDHRVQWELALGKRIGFYTLRGELGSGNFSRVRAGIHTLTKERVAIKILDKRKMDKKTKRLLSREISSMEKLHHPHIVHLYEVIHTETKLNLVMEYASGGELFTRLSTQGKMPESEAKIVFAQIVSALQHMHQHHVIHRDLKAENVFYSEKRHVKVGDFGFSTEANGSTEALNTFCGSPPYAAPELFRDSFYFGESVDIWALGILLFFTVTGTMPFRAETVGKLKKRILSGQFAIPSHVSSECKALIRGILKPVPSERFTIREIRCSDWLSRTAYPQPMGYYRLEPTQIDLKQCKPEEAYALCYLEKLGIDQEHLKSFKFSSQESHSPFSWHAKNNVDAAEYRLIARRPIFGSSRASQITLNDDFQINEFSALVGTYRILLLRAHKRLYGPSGNEELRKLRALTEHALAKIRDPGSDGSTTPWTCSLCDVTPANGHMTFSSGSTGNSSPSSPDGDSRDDSGHRSTGPPKRWLDATFAADGVPRTNGVGRHSRRVSPSGNSHTTRSKMCVIL
uniref:non-specific serine/threonine protein kinase n=1 Tax=Phallusia mammillata TaxID=59560 RepID=A0A6F9DKZ6_9ASCI|nr:serine/threonine-protein kinase NIM1 [Phallusia mammillata]